MNTKVTEVDKITRNTQEKCVVVSPYTLNNTEVQNSLFSHVKLSFLYTQDEVTL